MAVAALLVAMNAARSSSHHRSSNDDSFKPDNNDAKQRETRFTGLTLHQMIEDERKEFLRPYLLELEALFRDNGFWINDLKYGTLYVGADETKHPMPSYTGAQNDYAAYKEFNDGPYAAANKAVLESLWKIIQQSAYRDIVKGVVQGLKLGWPN